MYIQSGLRMSSFGRAFVVPFALATTVVFSACTGAAAPAPATNAPPATSAVSSVAPTGVLPASSPVAAAAVSPRVNANTASQDEVQRALEAAGVPSSARWAREVVEYRPYPTDDPSLAKLRQELRKYNPAPEVVDQIVATLTL